MKNIEKIKNLSMGQAAGIESCSESPKNIFILGGSKISTKIKILEKMMEKFDNPEIFVAPFLKKFEIQKDFCYDLIFNKFWEKFFETHPQPLSCKEGGIKIIFNFENALKSILWEKAIFDERDTLKDKDFYSYRRDKTEKRNYTIHLNI